METVGVDDGRRDVSGTVEESHNESARSGPIVYSSSRIINAYRSTELKPELFQLTVSDSHKKSN